MGAKDIESLGVLQENEGVGREIKGSGACQKSVLCNREVVVTQMGQGEVQGEQGPLQEGVQDGGHEAPQIVQALDVDRSFPEVKEGCGTGNQKLVAASNAIDLIVIDNPSCGVRIGSGISGTSYGQNISGLDERLETRTPLLDCTNILRSQPVREKSDSKLSKKGNWKRRA